MYMVFELHRKHIYGPPRPVMEIALLSYMYMMFVPHRKHTYEPPQPGTERALLFYVNYVRTSQETPMGFTEYIPMSLHRLLRA
jgi:hypothetical protein